MDPSPRWFLRLFPFPFLFVLATLGAAPVAAQSPTPLGEEFQINTYAPGPMDDIAAPGLAFGPAGDFVVVWDFESYDALYGNAVIARTFDSNGTPGGEFAVSEFEEYYDLDPSVAAGSDGTFVVVWAAPPTGYEIYSGIRGRRIDSLGNLLGTEFAVNDGVENSETRPRIASSPEGFVVVWQQTGQDGDREGVFARRLDSVGAPLGTEISINLQTLGSQRVPEVAMAGDGRWAVAWEDANDDGASLRARWFDSAGNALGLDREIVPRAVGFFRPSIASTPSGSFLLTWRSDPLDGSGSGIAAQYRDSVGFGEGPPLVVNETTSGEQGAPKAAATETGDFLVVWGSDDGSSFGVFGQQLTPAHARTGEFPVNSYTTGGQGVRAVAAGPEKTLAAVWLDLDRRGLYGRRFVRTLVFADGFESGDTTAWSFSVP